MATIAPRRPRLLLITFDLHNPVPGDARYRDVDRYLRSLGKMLRPLKQTRLVVTNVSENLILRSIRSRIGMHGGVHVLRLSRRSRIFVADPVVRGLVRRLIRRFGSP